MKEFSKVVVKILGLLFGLLLLGFTGFETFSFLLKVTNNVVVAVIGLIMFEGGFLYWAAVFKSEAEGLMQMAISLLASLADITLVVLSVGLQLGAIDAAAIDATIPAKIVVAAVIGNLLAKYFYSLSSPDVMKNIWSRALQGYMLARTFITLETKVNDVATRMASDMAVTWFNEFSRDFFNTHEALTNRRDPLALSQTTDDQPRWWPFGKKEDDEAPDVIVLESAEQEPQPITTRRFTVERVMARLGDVAGGDSAAYKEIARLAIQGVSWEAIQLNHLNKFGQGRPLVDVMTMISRVRNVIQALEIEQELNEEIAAANSNPK